MEVTLIGMGPGDPSALTGGALAALEQADVLIGSRRLVERCALSPEAQRFSSTKSAEIVEILASGPWECPCVLYSGDTGFHSGTRTLLPLLEERGISWRVLPGVSSMQYFAAMLGRPWQEWQVVSAHGLACDPVGEVLSAKGRPVFFLTGGAGGAAALCRPSGSGWAGQPDCRSGGGAVLPGGADRGGPGLGTGGAGVFHIVRPACGRSGSRLAGALPGDR